MANSQLWRANVGGTASAKRSSRERDGQPNSGTETSHFREASWLSSQPQLEGRLLSWDLVPIRASIELWPRERSPPS